MNDDLIDWLRVITQTPGLRFWWRDGPQYRPLVPEVVQANGEPAMLLAEGNGGYVALWPMEPDDIVWTTEPQSVAEMFARSQRRTGTCEVRNSLRCGTCRSSCPASSRGTSS